MKVLIAEDDPISCSRLATLLQKWDYEVVETDSGAAALTALQDQDGPRIAILDWQMPEMDGLQVCKTLRQTSLEPYVYVMLLTGRKCTDDSIAGWEAGVDDYITKPFDTQELHARLRAAERIVKLQDELIVARETQRQLATYDALTNILNRRAILERLKEEVLRAQRGEASVGVIMADLDHFKNINDTHGHPIGDLVLCEAAHRMKAALRTYDILGRYGGEEFLLVLPGCATQEAVIVAERLRARLADLPLTLREKRIRITGSFGVSSSKDVTEDVEAVIWAADAALYRAKHEGRNRVVSWEGGAVLPDRYAEEHRL
jgi:two-component system cell cycle response regulator